MQMAVAAGHARAPIFVRGAWPVCDSSGPMRDSTALRIASASAYRRLAPASAAGSPAKRVERRSEARLQPDRRLALNELVGEIDHGALIDSAIEGYAHVPRDRVGDARKTEFAHAVRRLLRRDAGSPLAMSWTSAAARARCASIGSPASLQSPGEARRERGDRAAMAARRVRASPPRRAWPRIPPHRARDGVPTPPRAGDSRRGGPCPIRHPRSNTATLAASRSCRASRARNPPSPSLRGSRRKARGG